MISAIITIGSIAILAGAILAVIIPNFNAFVDFIQRGIELISHVLPSYVPPVLVGFFGTVAAVLLICKIINR